MKTVIIEDEALAQERLIRLLEPYSKQLDLVGSASDGKTAIELINEKQPDLIFLDIQMPEFNGFEVLERINHRPWVIFTTAYDEYALKAFETNSVDYLLKPIDKDRLKQAIEKLQRLSPDDQSLLQTSIANLVSQMQQPKPKKMVVRLGDKVKFIDYADIFYFHAKDKYVEVHTFDHTYVIEQSLYSLEEQLANQGFIRIHRSTIINADHVGEAFRWFNGKYKVRMANKEKSELVVSLSMKHNLGL